jgi:cobyrinic acid a,c-diamide synthase
MEICVSLSVNGDKFGIHRLILAHAHKVNFGLDLPVLLVVEAKYGVQIQTVAAALKGYSGME